jgi:tetratricopeptide (TPR) repeat protein
VFYISNDRSGCLVSGSSAASATVVMTGINYGKRMNEHLDELFSKGIAFRDNGQLLQAVAVFRTIIEIYPNDSKLDGTYTVLGGIYFDLNDFDGAQRCFEKATRLKPKSELASLGLYLSYVELKKHERAIDELERYLDQYPADLYRDTLEELLGDLENGYATNFQETIVRLAEKHGVYL